MGCRTALSGLWSAGSGCGCGGRPARAKSDRGFRDHSETVVRPQWEGFVGFTPAVEARYEVLKETFWT